MASALAAALERNHTAARRAPLGALAHCGLFSRIGNLRSARAPGAARRHRQSRAAIAKLENSTAPLSAAAATALHRPTGGAFLSVPILRLADYLSVTGQCKRTIPTLRLAHFIWSETPTRTCLRRRVTLSDAIVDRPAAVVARRAHGLRLTLAPTVCEHRSGREAPKS